MFAIRSPGFSTVNNVFVSVFWVFNSSSFCFFFRAALDKALAGISFCFRAFVGRSPEGGACGLEEPALEEAPLRSGDLEVLGPLLFLS